MYSFKFVAGLFTFPEMLALFAAAFVVQQPLALIGG